MSKKAKLSEAKALLKALGLPPKQHNDRSGRVFLALANVTPTDKWSAATAPLLPTVDIMAFIRDHYGKSYKPNTRETIRRGTLHQFEQARIVDRNRDNPERATNSKDNNYSLNQPILDILSVYPNEGWQEKVKDFRRQVGALTAQYERQRDLKKIPVTLPDGSTITLSPGKHNQLHADIVHQFCPRFVGDGGQVLYIGDTASSRRDEGGKFMVLHEKELEDIGVPLKVHDKLPDLVVYNPKKEWLFLIEAVTSHGPVSPKRWNELETALEGCSVERIYVSAFPHTSEFKKHVADIAWETEVWIADSPDHMIHFNGDKFLGP